MNLYLFFKGEWQFQRTVKSWGVPYAEGEGFTEFASIDKMSLSYYEKGKMKFVAKEIETTFYKNFRYNFNDNFIEVIFNDGVDSGKTYQKYLLDINTFQISAVEKYLCADDLYEGFYYIVNNDNFILNTQIEGPHKKTEIQTVFNRKS